MDFEEVRKQVQIAVGRGEVVRIHPLDLAEIICASDEIDLVKIKAVDNGDARPYFYVNGKTYFQTVEEPCKSK